MEKAINVFKNKKLLQVKLSWLALAFPELGTAQPQLVFISLNNPHTQNRKGNVKLNNIYHDVIEKHDDAANDTPNSIIAILRSILY